MTILCVDDKQQQLENTVSMSRELLPETDTVQGFNRAGDALDWIRQRPADVALLETKMPDMNGLELAEEIKRLWPDTAIIFLTDHSEYALQAFAVRAVGYLLKPVSKDRLAAEIAYALGSGQHRQTPHIEDIR